MNKFNFFLAALILTISHNILASNGEEKSFIFNGNDFSQHFITLNGEATRTEYRYEEVADTCYRQILVGYYPVCRNIPRTRCYNTPGSCHQECYSRPHGERVCRTVCTPGRRICDTHYETICTNEPRYETEAYTCYRTVQIPYQVHDHYTSANVTINFGELPQDVIANEKFTVSLNGDDLSLKASGNQQLISLQKNKSIKSYWENDTKVYEATYDVIFINATKALLPVEKDITDIEVNRKTLSFSVGKILNPNAFIPSLKIKQRHLIPIGKKLLFNRNLTSGQYTLKNDGDRTKVIVDIDNLGIGRLKKRKHFFTFGAEVKFNMPILTEKTQLPSLKIEKRTKKRIKD